MPELQRTSYARLIGQSINRTGHQMMPYTCCLRPDLDAKRPVENPTIAPMDEVSGIRDEIIRNLTDDGDALQLELQIDESGSG